MKLLGPVFRLGLDHLPSALTPVDIHNTEFAKASFGRRVHDENDVGMLLNEATGEMIRLLEENDAFRTSLDAGGRLGTAERDR